MKSLSEAPIGSLVFETVEQYEATVVAHQFHQNGCNRVVLQERRLKDGKPLPRESVDIQVIKPVRRNETGQIAEPADDILGLLARDNSTGYEGRISIVQTNANGGRDFVLQTSARTSSGDRVDAIWIDEEFVELLEPRRVIETARPPGPGNSEEPAALESPL